MKMLYQIPSIWVMKTHVRITAFGWETDTSQKFDSRDRWKIIYNAESIKLHPIKIDLNGEVTNHNVSHIFVIIKGHPLTFPGALF